MLPDLHALYSSPAGEGWIDRTWECVALGREERGVLMKIRAVVFRPLTSYSHDVGTELCRVFAHHAAFHKADTSH